MHARFGNEMHNTGCLTLLGRRVYYCAAWQLDGNSKPINVIFM